jgi:hypothetical protein
VEFKQHRQYVPGDEIRHLDWRIFGKTDRFYIREYEEETNLRCTMLLDASGSMNYGSPQGRSKLVYAQRLAACLAYLMLGQQDSVGLVTFDDKVRRYNYGEFWIPRVEMINAATPRDRYDTAILVSPDGTVNYSERCKAVLSTKFQLKRFPFDTQMLSIVIHPFISSAGLIAFSLNDHRTWLSSELETFSSLAQWRLEAVLPHLTQWKQVDGAEEPEIRFDISVERRSNFYVWKVILPLTLMVVISWAAFWIEASDLDNQLQVAVTTILTVIAFAFAISATMPRVPYLTYIDAFFLECYVFVFLAIVELMTVHITHSSNRRRDLGLKIRRYSRFMVPIAFLVCNIVLAFHFLT